jgi:hypothetical protein
MSHPLKNGYVCGFRTICEVHREMYDIVIEKGYKGNLMPSDEKLIQLLKESFVMAKKMNNKLRQYKFNYDDGWWERTNKADFKEKLDRRGELL